MTETTVETSPAEEATPAKMHAYSVYLNIGPGAEECDCIKTVERNGGEVRVPDGSCTREDHFHVWCRLPNQFERGTLRDKAAAAAARRLRLLREEDSDVRVILDGELEAIRARDAREELIEEIVNKDFLQNHLQALKEVNKEEDDYATIDEDRERLRALEGQSVEERPAEEFEHLRNHLEEHTAKVNARRDQIEKPARDAIKDKPIEELVEIVREQRIEALGNSARAEEYSKWEWYICTFKPKSPDLGGFPNERAFPHINEFTSAAPELIESIAQTITDLERESNESLKG